MYTYNIYVYMYLHVFFPFFINPFTSYMHQRELATNVMATYMHVRTCTYMLSVLCCFALFVCLTLLATFFLPSHLSFKNMYIYFARMVVTYCIHVGKSPLTYQIFEVLCFRFFRGSNSNLKNLARENFRIIMHIRRA